MVIKPDMAKYAEAGRTVRELMLEVTPLVEPISIDEAFLDLSGTHRLHGMSPAMTLARLIARITRKSGSPPPSDCRTTSSWPSSPPTSRSRAASRCSDGRRRWLPCGKARGLHLGRGQGDAGGACPRRHHHDRPAAADGEAGPHAPLRQHGCEALSPLARRGRPHVSTDDHAKSISAETTFNTDIRDRAELERILWPLAEKVSRRAKAEGVAGHTVVLKLKTADFKIRTRNVSLADPTLLAARIYDAALPLLAREAKGTAFRLIGVGISGLVEARPEQETETLDATTAQRARAELAVDRIRGKFGRGAVGRGIGFGEED
jgi:DNA polymerase IV